jgi:hypothetical protein
MNRVRVIYLDDKPVGTVEGQTFVKCVQASRHFLRTPPAIAIDSGVVRELKALGVQQVRVIDLESSKVYVAPLQYFDDHGITVNRGHGEQRALLLDQWQVSS